VTFTTRICGKLGPERRAGETGALRSDDLAKRQGQASLRDARLPAGSRLDERLPLEDQLDRTDPAVDGHSFRRSIKASGSDSVTTIPRFSVLMNPSETARSNKATSGS